MKDSDKEIGAKPNFYDVVDIKPIVIEWKEWYIMGYKECPCFKCDSGEKRESRIECRGKCTQFVAWKLSMQAMREKKKEDKDKYYSITKKKFYDENLMKQKSGRKIW